MLDLWQNEGWAVSMIDDRPNRGQVSIPISYLFYLIGVFALSLAVIATVFSRLKLPGPESDTGALMWLGASVVLWVILLYTISKASGVIVDG